MRIIFFCVEIQIVVIKGLIFVQVIILVCIIQNLMLLVIGVLRLLKFYIFICILIVEIDLSDLILYEIIYFYLSIEIIVIGGNIKVMFLQEMKYFLIMLMGILFFDYLVFNQVNIVFICFIMS